MIGGISGAGSWYTYMGGYASGRTAPVQPGGQVRSVLAAGRVTGVRRAAAPELPVEPVRPVKAVDSEAFRPLSLGIPLREGVDPVEMAVRMRIRYADQGAAPAEEAPAGEETAALGAEGVQKAAEEGRCETCEKRKYQDESDDPGVSFQTPTQVDPGQAASAVRGHEMEHVVREQAKAQREDRKVVSQSVSIHTDICPECGRVYVSGGTTRTVTASSDTSPVQPDSGGEEKAPFRAVA